MPDYEQELRFIFRCDFRFSQSCCKLIFKRSYLDKPLIRSNLELKEFLTNSPADLMTIPGEDNSLSAQIQRMILNSSPGPLQFPKIGLLAKMLNISPQTLHRRLVNDGTSYQQIKNYIRRDIAINKLVKEKLSVDEVSRILDFSEPSSLYPRLQTVDRNVSPGLPQDGLGRSLPISGPIKPPHIFPIIKPLISNYSNPMHSQSKQGVILIGMPGAGKSTLGIQLAKELGFDFVDTDVSIQVHMDQTLQEIIDSSDYLNLRRIEEAVLLKTHCHNKVVATGGSAVYSETGMNHLREQGVVIFLDTPLSELQSRIHNYDTRGIARRPEQTLEDVFAERQKFYEKYAEVTIQCAGLNQQTALTAIAEQLKGYQ